MNTITVTAYNRPDYLREVVASINRCDECNQFQMFACVEAGDAFESNETALFSLIIPVHILTTTDHLGPPASAQQVLDWAFTAGSEFNVGLDDDCIISPDALRLALWFKDNVEFFDVLEFFARNRQADAPPDELEAHPTFNAWGWACRPQTYQRFIRQAFDDKSEPLWDLAAHKVMLQHGLRALRPRLSRSMNIGRDRATSITPEYYDHHMIGFNFNTADYRGDYRIVDMNLSIIIASINDQEETLATIKSIRDTAGDEPEIVLVDDCSGTPIAGDWRFKDFKNLKIVSNRFRCGCGPSRHIGALNASGDWLLITDSHMRFTEGWLDAAAKALRPTLTQGEWESGGPKAIHCATCLGLDRDHMDVDHPVAEYNGATFNFRGPDRQKPELMQTLEVVWLHDQWPDDGAESPAIMGAGYFVSKDWFLHLGACRFLRTWGQDELFLSLKSWLAGGSVRMLRSVRIGHRFPVKNELKWFALPSGHVQFNKLMAAHSLFPPSLAGKFENWILTPENRKDMADVNAARNMLRADWHIIAAEIAYNKMIFTRDIHWLAAKFGLILP